MKHFLSAATLCLLALPAFSAEVERTTDGRFDILTPRADATVDDWPALREQLIAAFGLRQLPSLPFDQYDEFGDANLPAAFGATVQDVEILVFSIKPLSTDRLVPLTDLYDDIGQSALESYNAGLVIEAAPNDDGVTEVSVEFYKNVRGQSAGGIALTKPFPLTLPAGTEVMSRTGKEGDASQIITASIPGDQETIARDIENQLRANGTEFERRDREGVAAVVASTPKGDLIFQVLDDDNGKTSSAFITVVSYQ